MLEKKSVAELREIASALGMRGLQRLKKAELVDRIVSSAGDAKEEEVSANGHGGADAEVADEGGADAEVADEGGADAEVADEGRADAEGRADDRTARDQRDDRAAEGDDRRERDSNDRRHERGDDRGPRDRDRGGRDRKRGRPRSDNDGRGPNGDPEAEVREGILDLLPEGYGFLRCTGYLAGAQDVYVSQSFVRRFDLRRGDLIAGPIRRNRNSDKFPALARVDRIEGVTFDPRADEPRRPAFGELTALSPSERLVLERPDGPLSLRVMDLLTPIGKGQRGLVVAPPRAGKTTLLKQLAAALEGADPDLHVMALFVDARPEEVTDLEQSCDAEVVATTFEQSAEDHTQIAELVVERAKRLVERGRDVVVLLDSLTRLTRAYNIVVPSSGRVLPGGLDPAALYPAKRLFAAARNVEGEGSLTVVATALTGDGSRMDEVIVEGFADTANMELHLDGGLAQQRILPAVDLIASGTRREDRLLSEAELTAVARLRRDVAGLTLEDAVPRVLDRMEQAGSNERFVTEVGDAGLG
ncbi:MAG: transcription termination factor Rho [Nitriliruptor sp.]|nr:MAG: transcription termination factor Rho [Nitriliruptor sp.]